MGRSSDTPFNLTQQLRERTSLLYKTQLESINLGKKQIQSQSLEELQDSLERLNNALEHPDSFGILKLNASASAGLYITKSSESLIEIGILPLLLERKNLITERLRELKSKIVISNLRDFIETVSSNDLKEQLLTEFEALKQYPSAETEVEITPNYAFIAMSMDPNNPELEDVLDAIKYGANKCGVSAERVDEVQTNERITERTLESIITAEYVVVDLTCSRPNVYYEAGFAQGLGKTPIYVAKKGTEIHFDVKDYPVILYSNFRELKDSLAERLRAIGTGRGKT